MTEDYSRSQLRKGQKASIIVFFISIGLVIIKFIGGIISNSSSLMSDALNSGSDSIVMIGTWIGLRIAQKKPTNKFQYGFYRAESLVTLGVAAFIIIGAFELIIEGYIRLFSIPNIEFPVQSSIIAIISAFFASISSLYLIHTGNKINSQLLIASGKERMGDIFISIAVFISIILSYFMIPFIDGITSIIISILILRIGILTSKDAIFALMDISPSKKIEEKIKSIIKNISTINSFDALKLRKAGPFVFGEITIKLKKNMDVERASEISEDIIRKIRANIKEIIQFSVYIKPSELKKYKIVIPIDDENGLESIISKHFGRAKRYLIVIVENDRILDYYSIENEFVNKNIRAGLITIKNLLKEDINIIITNQLGEISFHTLHDHLIDIYQFPAIDKVKNVLQNFFENKLTRLKKPTKEKEKID
ncbi:MAG: cation diffusion facilitator family transporter [Candidatus Helarchaeota archaeon]